MVVAASSWTAYSMPRAENAPVFVREVLPGNSRTEITLVLYEMLSEARRRPVASSGPPEVGVKSAVNTPTFSPWRAQRPVQKGWCSKVGVEILKNTPTCARIGLRDFVMGAQPARRTHMARDGHPNLRTNRPWTIAKGQPHSSEASSRTPSSMRDLSRKEKLSRIVLRWLPSG